MASRWPRRLGITAGGLLTVLALFVAAAWGLTEWRFRRTWTVEPRQVALSSDSATLTRGQHLVSAVVGCADCHGSDLGGKTMIDNAAMGLVASTNLTAGKGGIGSTYSDADWVRAIRHGVNKDGKALMIMPSSAFAKLSDADLGAVISYIKTLPAIDRERPARKINVLPRALMTLGIIPKMAAEEIVHDSTASMATGPSATKEYGRYLASVGGCTSCHGPNLSGGGGGEPGAPPAANLTPTTLGKWTEADFMRALREGKRPDGSQISDFMPWKTFGKMTDEELKALWTYVSSVPARELGEK
jgi:mono/diheme cytochrome c family protein